MAMKAGGSRGRVAEINMTPMIDVLLVLLIIFMVAQQSMQRGLSVMVPPPSSSTASTEAAPIVLEIEAAGRYSINRQPVDAARVQESVAAVFNGRPRKVLFVKAAEAVSYGEVVRAVDASRSAGVEVISLLPRAGAAGAH